MKSPHPRDIFLAAVDLVGDARHAYLEDACGDDPALRSEIEKLLAADDRARARREPDSTTPVCAEAEGGDEPTRNESEDDRSSFDESAVFDHECDNCERLFEVARGVEKIPCPYCGDMNRPTQLGSEFKEGDRRSGFVIMGILGEGGMGKVYHARETSHGDREVALKVISARLNPDVFEGRFREEQEILLRLSDHPWIARIHYIGRFERGLPFINMEYVDGTTLLRYCDERSLSIDDRIRLFQDVCSAIEHAHAKNIIHRDLKPGNILVKSGPDGSPEPRIIDFGLAKALDQKFTDMTHTDPGTKMGTFEYAAPEQLGGKGRVGIETDIYALGVVLQQLVGGTRPFEECTDEEMNPYARRLELIERVKAGEPVSSAIRFEGLPIEEQRLIAVQRGRRPESLLKVLRGDLGDIVRKCTECDPEARYRNLSELRTELGRFLERRPVTARRTTALYALEKWVQRHRRLVALAALVALAVGFLGWVNWDRARAYRQVDLLVWFVDADPEELAMDSTAEERAEAALNLEDFVKSGALDLLSNLDLPQAKIHAMQRTAIILEQWEVAARLGALAIARHSASTPPSMRVDIHVEQSQAFRRLGQWSSAFEQVELAQDAERAHRGESDKWIELELRRAAYLDEDDDETTDGNAIYESVWRRLQELDPGIAHPDRPLYAREVSWCYAIQIRDTDPGLAYEIMREQFYECTIAPDQAPDNGTINDARIFVHLLLAQGRCAEATRVATIWLAQCEQLVGSKDSRFEDARTQLSKAEACLKQGTSID